MLGAFPVPTAAQVATSDRPDSVRLQFTNTDMVAAVQAIGRFLTKPILAQDLADRRVGYFETPRPVAVSELPAILAGLAETHGLHFVEDSSFYRISAAPVEGDTAREVQSADSVGVRLFTVRLEHARASDVAGTLNQLYGVGGGFTGITGLASGTLSDQLRTDRGEGELEDAGPDPGGAALNAEVTIVPDELTNSLLIRALPSDFETLLEGIAELDVRPLQVLIEVLAVEARKDRQFALGFSAELPPQDLGDATVQGGFTGVGLGDLVVQVMSLGKEEINATITAARTRGDVEIISRPVVLASNNVEATLLVGTQQPFVQVSRSLPTDEPQRDQVVQYRDVGTKLTVLPTINQDGYVSLLIQQEISQATGETQFSAPIISSREATTQVLVRDRQTIVIGGLRDRVQDHVRTGIPLLSDIPLLGALFGGTRSRTNETELFLFITPTILRDDAAADSVTRVRLPEGLGVPDLIPVGDTVPDADTGSHADSVPDADTARMEPDTVPRLRGSAPSGVVSVIVVTPVVGGG